MYPSYLIEQQLSLEAEMRDAGLERYRCAIRSNPEATEILSWDGQLLRVIEATTVAIEEARSHAEDGRATRRLRAARLLPFGIASDQLALITVRHAIDLLLRRDENNRSLCELTKIIGSDVESETARLQRIDRSAENCQQSDLLRIIYPAIPTGVTGLQPWTTEQIHQVGGLLAGCLFETDMLCRNVLIREGKKKKYIIVLKPELAEWLPTVDLRAHLPSPKHLPMIIPPLNWGEGQLGGYLTGATMPGYSLVTRRDGFDLETLKAAERAIDGDRAKSTMDAINAMQRTPWRINQAVLKTAEQVHQQEHAEISNRMEQRRVLDIAERFKDCKRIYFPWRQDFRARAYPRIHLLNSQGDDMKRSLLMFADGQPVKDEKDKRWLKIHGANLFGKDKVSFEERTAWVDENVDDIEQSARDPMAHRFWQSADKPYQALAWCREYDHIHQGGFGTLTHHPCAIDGTCSTLQHFNAIMRDEEGGALVNLLPGDRPRDIYGEVASRVRMRLRLMGTPQAQALLAFGIDRKLTKKPVMTAPYGSTRWTMVGHMEEILLRRAVGKPILMEIIEGRPHELASLLCEQIWAAMKDLLQGPMAVMDWLRNVTEIVADREGKNLIWTPPHGIAVVQPYFNSSKKRIRIDIGKKRTVQLDSHMVDKDDPEINKARARSAICANFMHSLDAAHMYSTIGRAKDDGIRSFHMIHDSFGTDCTRMDDLSRITRETFVEMYENSCPLEAFLADVEKMVSRKTIGAFPPIPEKGNLDRNRGKTDGIQV